MKEEPEVVQGSVVDMELPTVHDPDPGRVDKERSGV